MNTIFFFRIFTKKNECIEIKILIFILNFNFLIFILFSSGKLINKNKLIRFPKKAKIDKDVFAKSFRYL